MTLLALVTNPLAYLTIFAAAAIEGEIVFVGAATLVSQGQLNAIGVAIAGALGATCGDQFYFYALRGRLRPWLDRIPAVSRHGPKFVYRVRRRETLTILAIRFSPGLRVALTAACAYADVPALKFTLLSVVSSVAWSIALLLAVAWAGPKYLPGIGISGWWATLIPAFVIVSGYLLAARASKDALEHR